MGKDEVLSKTTKYGRKIDFCSLPSGGKAPSLTFDLSGFLRSYLARAGIITTLSHVDFLPAFVEMPEAFQDVQFQCETKRNYLLHTNIRYSSSTIGDLDLDGSRPRIGSCFKRLYCIVERKSMSDQRPEVDESRGD